MKKPMTQRRKSRSRPAGAGCLVWLAGLVVVIAIFLVKQDDIRSAISKSRILEILEAGKTSSTTIPAGGQDSPPPDAQKGGGGNGGAAPPAASRPSAPSGTPSGVAPQAGSGTDPATSAPGAVPAAPTSGTTASPGPVAGESGRPSATLAPASAGETRPAGPGTGTEPGSNAAPAARPGTRISSLYFVRIEDDGTIARQEVKRAIPSSDSPLADSLKALLSGPTEDEIRRKLISLVPRGTRLIGVTLRGGTAVVDLSDAFMYNHYGIEGYAGQLKQVVYTATSFGSVQDVQILIEGKVRDYLGGEGVYIGKPLSRNSF